MLRELRVVDFAIIDEALIEFSSGLNILTGETGAGKSILIEALGLALGGRSSEEMIRSGSQTSIVEAGFETSNLTGVEKWLEESGYDSGDELVIRRVVSRSGKNRAYLNGSPVTVAQVRSLGANLVDIHGQNDHQTLLNPIEHLKLLDGYLDLGRKLSEYGAAYNELELARKRLARAKSGRKEMERRIDLLTHQVSEISDADLQPGEDAELAMEKQRLSNAEKLLELSSSVIENIDEAEVSATNTTHKARAIIDQIVAIDPSVTPTAEKLGEALYGLEEVVSELRNYVDMIDGDSGRLEEVDGRLELIKNLKRKYGETIEEIVKFGAEAEHELQKLSFERDNSDKLAEEVTALTSRAGKLAKSLDMARKAGEGKFSSEALSELSDLNMNKAKLNPQFTYEEDEDGYLHNGKKLKLGPFGFGHMEFLFSANLGEPPKPLVKVASGGEISRLMLALKTITRGQSSEAIMVFDEVDTGIGGATADMLGKKLKTLALENQVFVITHLAQVAKYADAHFKVAKGEIDGRVAVRINRLIKEDRVVELARMAAGAESADSHKSAVKWAREALKEARGDG